MRSSLLLVVLSLTMTFPSCRSTCEEQESPRPELENALGYPNVPRQLAKRYNDIDYDSFVGLMGRRNSDTNNLPPQKRDMHDVFVGLMGRRSSQLDEARPWRKEYPERRAGIFINKCKLKFRRGQ